MKECKLSIGKIVLSVIIGIISYFVIFDVISYLLALIINVFWEWTPIIATPFLGKTNQFSGFITSLMSLFASIIALLTIRLITGYNNNLKYAALVTCGLLSFVGIAFQIILYFSSGVFGYSNPFTVPIFAIVICMVFKKNLSTINT